MVSEAFDYLFLEPLLVERIQDQVQGLRLVGTAPDLEAVDELQQEAPAAYVIYLGDSTPGGAEHQGGSRRVQALTQYWAAVLTIHYGDAQGTGEGARREAGPLLGAMITALSGWTPKDCIRPLARAAQNVPTAYSNGFYYYPLVFEASFIFPRGTTWTK